MDVLEHRRNATLIVAGNDLIAISAIRWLSEQGVKVPDEISVTGFDNIRLSEFSHPPLTTLQIPRDRIGHLAFEMLTPESAKGKPPGREIVIDPEFVLRESTGPAPKR